MTTQKKKTLGKELPYQCKWCGFQSATHSSMCPLCHRWNAMRMRMQLEPKEGFTVGQVLSSPSTSLAIVPSEDVSKETIAIDNRIGKRTEERLPKRVSNVEAKVAARFSTGLRSLDHVLGGGAVLGSVVIVSAPPGSGKSTLSTMVAHHAATKSFLRTLYCCGEEPESRLAERCHRLELSATEEDPFDVFESNIVEEIIERAIDGDYTVVVVDSLGVLGSREGIEHKMMMRALCQFAGKRRATVFVVNHFTKDGQFAGDMATMHECDVAIVLEPQHDQPGIVNLGYGDPLKNRYGPTTRAAKLMMSEKGLADVALFDLGEPVPL